MSFETWKREFYPYPASALVNQNALGVIERDLKKWKGLTKENLQKHGLTKKNGGGIRDEGGNTFEIDSGSCGLCTKYFNFSKSPYCSGCPLYIVRGSIGCNNQTADEITSPYHQFTRENDPTFMLYWLQKAKESVMITPNEKLLKEAREEIEDLKENLQKLQAKLEEELPLPFQKELDAFLEGVFFNVVEATCGNVVLQGHDTGTKIRINEGGLISIETKRVNPYSLYFSNWERLVKLAKAVKDCNDC